MKKIIGKLALKKTKYIDSFKKNLYKGRYGLLTQLFSNMLYDCRYLDISVKL